MLHKTVKNEKEKTILTVSLVSAATNTALAVLKVIIGYFGHSQALIADGIHSFSDLISDVLVYFTAKASTQDPDDEHPYGHQRIETIGTLLVALMLMVVAGAIGYEAIARLTAHLSEKPTFPVIIVALISVLANEGLFYYSLKAGKKIQSSLLISNAWHNRSDVFVSIIVLLSAIGAMSGLHWLDAVGALIITALIFKIAFKMLWQCVQELIDRAVDIDTLAAIKNVVESISGVRSLHQLRTRLHGNAIFIDLHIIVDPFISVSEGHHIGEEVHLALLKTIKNCHDVVIHIDPENDEIAHPSIHLLNRTHLEKEMSHYCKTLPYYKDIKKIRLHYLNGKLYIDIFMPEKILETQTLLECEHLYQNALSPIKNCQQVKIYITL